MKLNQNFRILYIILILGQIVLCNFAQFGPYVMLSMLPAMVICIPTSVSTSLCMLIAFATGLSVDWLSEGLLGINAAAIVPVAFARKAIIRSFMGEDIISRNDSFSFRKNGFTKVSFIIFISCLIFLSIYMILDGAGTRPFSFTMARIGVSLGCNFILGLLVTNILTFEDRK